MWRKPGFEAHMLVQYKTCLRSAPAEIRASGYFIAPSANKDLLYSKCVETDNLTHGNLWVNGQSISYPVRARRVCGMKGRGREVLDATTVSLILEPILALGYFGMNPGGLSIVETMGHEQTICEVWIE